MNLDFSGSSTTDGGVTLTAKTRYRTTGSATGLFSGPQASISNGAMSLTVGNAAGAVAQTAGVWGCGTVMWGCHDLTDDGWASNWATRSSGGAGPDVIRLDMALGGASVSVSGGNGNDAELAVSMPMGAGSVGIGYDNDNADTQKAITQVNYSGSVGDMGVGVKLAQQNAVTAYIASVSAPAGGGSVYIFAALSASSV
jgi:hypothetical protein